MAPLPSPTSMPLRGRPVSPMTSMSFFRCLLHRRDDLRMPTQWPIGRKGPTSRPGVRSVLVLPPPPLRGRRLPASEPHRRGRRGWIHRAPTCSDGSRTEARRGWGGLAPSASLHGRARARHAREGRMEGLGEADMVAGDWTAANRWRRRRPNGGGGVWTGGRLGLKTLTVTPL